MRQNYEDDGVGLRHRQQHGIMASSAVARIGEWLESKRFGGGNMRNQPAAERDAFLRQDQFCAPEPYKQQHGGRGRSVQRQVRHHGVVLNTNLGLS
jgi:hypothetical protein